MLTVVAAMNSITGIVVGSAASAAKVGIRQDSLTTCLLNVNYLIKSVREGCGDAWVWVGLRILIMVDDTNNTQVRHFKRIVATTASKLINSK